MNKNYYKAAVIIYRNDFYTEGNSILQRIKIKIL